MHDACEFNYRMDLVYFRCQPGFLHHVFCDTFDRDLSPDCKDPGAESMTSDKNVEGGEPPSLTAQLAC